MTATDCNVYVFYQRGGYGHDRFIVHGLHLKLLFSKLQYIHHLKPAPHMVAFFSRQLKCVIINLY